MGPYHGDLIGATTAKVIEVPWRDNRAVLEAAVRGGGVKDEVGSCIFSAARNKYYYFFSGATELQHQHQMSPKQRLCRYLSPAGEALLVIFQLAWNARRGQLVQGLFMCHVKRA
jgi:hypothetical protein